MEIVDRAPASLTGTVTVSIAVSADSQAASTTEYTGSFDLEYSIGEDGSTLSLTDIEASTVRDSMTDRLRSGRLIETISGLEFSVEFEGRLESEELGGSFDFDTTTAYRGDRGSFPTAGELLLTATNSTARIRPSADPELDEHADYQVDSAGTGQYSDAVSVRWLDWISGSVFSWYPLIRELSIMPRIPFAWQSLNANYRLYSPRGGPLSLTYEWVVNGAVLMGATTG